jgi:carboxypeptidase Taq
MNAKKAFEWLLDKSRDIAYLQSMKALLIWDQHTFAPPKGLHHRADQIAAITRLIHSRITDPKRGDMLREVEGTDLVKDASSVEAVNVREWRRSFDRATKIPESLAGEISRASSEGETVWEIARPLNDWNSLRPHLERLVNLKREEASLLGFGKEPYNALLDDFEPGETAANIELVFSKLREPLVELLKKIMCSSTRPDTSVVHRHFPRSGQQAFEKYALKQIGFDFKAGRVNTSAHPFSAFIGPGDVRITTRYDESSFTMAFFSSLHEAGHAFYELGLPQEHWGTPMGQAISHGIHESQSRIWEKLVGTSLGFWKYFYHETRRQFSALREVSLDVFHSAVNDVNPSLIRTEADEITYNLHVMLRFELELALIRQDLSVVDLPEAWNKKMKSYLGLTPPDYSSGVMQDIHWSGG